MFTTQSGIWMIWAFVLNIKPCCASLEGRGSISQILDWEVESSPQPHVKVSLVCWKSYLYSSASILTVPLQNDPTLPEWYESLWVMIKASVWWWIFTITCPPVMMEEEYWRGFTVISKNSNRTEERQASIIQALAIYIADEVNCFRHLVV